MSDLSDLLGNVYGDPDGPPVRREPPAEDRSEAPAWADDERLNAAFAGWEPGPGPEASRFERDLLSGPEVSIPAPGSDLDDDLAAALSAAVVEADPAPADTAPAAPPVVDIPAWQPPAAEAPLMPPAPPAMPAMPTPAPPPPAPAMPLRAPEPAPAMPAMPAMPKEQAWTAPSASPTVSAPAQVAGPRLWQFGDDDIFPSKGRGRRK